MDKVEVFKKELLKAARLDKVDFQLVVGIKSYTATQDKESAFEVEAHANHAIDQVVEQLNKGNLEYLDIRSYEDFQIYLDGIKKHEDDLVKLKNAIFLHMGK